MTGPSPSSPSGTPLGRRAVVQLLGAGSAAFALAACSRGPAHRRGSGGGTTGTDAPTAGGTAGDPFASPEEVRSAGGRLDVQLAAAPVQLPWGTGTRFALAYNGSVPGPTWRVRPGDTVTLTLQNDLDQPTNLHTHGLHVSPSGSSDDVFVMIEPGGQRTYEYAIPDDHPSGTFWYHPHHHGSVAAQLSAGLCGVIVVEDELDDAGVLAATNERVMVLSDPAVGGDATVLEVTPMQQMQGREGDVVLVNGLLRPVITTETSTTERWRLVNASASRYYQLSLSLDTMHLIASDHGRLAEPVATDSLLLAPGQRAEVLVRCDVPGSFTLRTTVVDRIGMGGGMGGGGMGGGGMGGGGAEVGSTIDVLTVDVGGGYKAAAPLPRTLRALEPLDSLAVTGTREFTLGEMGMSSSAFTIDGRSFDAERTDTEVALGAVEDWTLTNASMMSHPFHLHVWPFRVVERSGNGRPDPGWRDTVDVPAGEAVTIRVAFRDFAGRAVYHCHILDHEDLGMMGTIEVT